MEGVRGGCGSGMYVSAEVGSLAAITSRNVSRDRSGEWRRGPVFLCLQIKQTNNEKIKIQIIKIKYRLDMNLSHFSLMLL